MADGGKRSGLHIPGFDTEYHGQLEGVPESRLHDMAGDLEMSDLMPVHPRVVGMEGFSRGLTLDEIEFAAPLAHTPMARRTLLMMLLAATGVVTGISLPRRAHADTDASMNSDAMSSDTSSDTSKSVAPFKPITDVYEVEILLPGGADTDYWLGYRGDTIPAHVKGGLRTPPPTQPTAPPNYLYVPDTTPGMGGNGLMHMLDFFNDVLLAITDHETTNHDTGKVTALTGDPNGTVPSIAVQRAAVITPNSPFAYVVGPGVGMVFTGGLNVGANSLDTNRLGKLVDPNAVGNGKETIFSTNIVSLLTSMRHDDIQAVLNGKFLPSLKRFAAGRDASQQATQEVAELLNLVKQVKQNQQDQLANGMLVGRVLFQKGLVGGISLQHNTSYDTHNDAFGTKQMQNYQSLTMSLYRAHLDAKQNGVKFRSVEKSDFNRIKPASDHYKYGGTLVFGQGVSGHRKVGVFNAEKSYVGEKSNSADIQQHLLGLNGLVGADLGVKTALTGITGPHRIQDLLDQQS